LIVIMGLFKIHPCFKKYILKYLHYICNLPSNDSGEILFVYIHAHTDKKIRMVKSSV
jgi:hypothetical protein